MFLNPFYPGPEKLREDLHPHWPPRHGGWDPTYRDERFWAWAHQCFQGKTPLDCGMTPVTVLGIQVHVVVVCLVWRVNCGPEYFCFFWNFKFPWWRMNLVSSKYIFSLFLHLSMALPIGSGYPSGSREVLLDPDTSKKDHIRLRFPGFFLKFVLIILSCEWLLVPLAERSGQVTQS